MRKLKGAATSVSHTEETIKELRADRQFAVEYLKVALEELGDPDNRAAGLLALRDVAEAYGGLGAVAAQAGISREALYRSLSPKGNPTLKTLLAVLKTVGMRLSVEPEITLTRRSRSTKGSRIVLVKSLGASYRLLQKDGR
jgi:probable addiction module antidote protein